jgi:hypothetical protein
MVAQTTQRAPASGHPILTSLLVVAVSAGSVVLALAAFADCDVGINQGANFLAATVFGLPGLMLLNALVVWGAGSATRRALSSRAFADRWGFAVQVLVLLISAYLCWHYVATPADYPSPICQDNVPAWAPVWLPS